MGKMRILLIIVLFTVACVGVDQQALVTPTPTVQAIPVPPAQTPEPVGTPEIEKARQLCDGEILVWSGSDYTVQMCNTWEKDQEIAEGTSLFFVAATTFAFKASEVVPIAVVTTAGGEVAGFFAVASSSAPVLGVLGVIVFPVLSVYQFMANPPGSDPLLEQWLANRYPTLAVSLAAAGVQDQVGILDLPERFVTDGWSEALKNFRIKNPFTAIILEDDAVLATATYLTLNKLGFTVIGIFPSCEAWMATGLVANLYVLDNMMLGWRRAPECAREIYARAPLAFVLIYSSASPDDPYKEGKTLRDFVEEAVGKDRTLGAEKNSIGDNLAREIMRFFGS